MHSIRECTPRTLSASTRVSRPIVEGSRAACAGELSSAKEEDEGGGTSAVAVAMGSREPHTGRPLSRLSAAHTRRAPCRCFATPSSSSVLFPRSAVRHSASGARVVERLSGVVLTAPAVVEDTLLLLVPFADGSCDTRHFQSIGLNLLIERKFKTDEVKHQREVEAIS